LTVAVKAESWVVWWGSWMVGWSVAHWAVWTGEWRAAKTVALKVANSDIQWAVQKAASTAGWMGMQWVGERESEWVAPWAGGWDGQWAAMKAVWSVETWVAWMAAW